MTKQSEWKLLMCRNNQLNILDIINTKHCMKTNTFLLLKISLMFMSFEQV